MVVIRSLAAVAVIAGTRKYIQYYCDYHRVLTKHLVSNVMAHDKAVLNLLNARQGKPKTNLNEEDNH